MLDLILMLFSYFKPGPSHCCQVLNRTFSDWKFNSSFNSEEQENNIAVNAIGQDQYSTFEELNGNFNYKSIFSLDFLKVPLAFNR
jgi:hypothetical protein